MPHTKKKSKGHIQHLPLLSFLIFLHKFSFHIGKKLKATALKDLVNRLHIRAITSHIEDVHTGQQITSQ